MENQMDQNFLNSIEMIISGKIKESQYFRSGGLTFFIIILDLDSLKFIHVLSSHFSVMQDHTTCTIIQPAIINGTAIHLTKYKIMMPKQLIAASMSKLHQQYTCGDDAYLQEILCQADELIKKICNNLSEDEIVQTEEALAKQLEILCARLQSQLVVNMHLFNFQVSFQAEGENLKTYEVNLSGLLGVVKTNLAISLFKNDQMRSLLLSQRACQQFIDQSQVGKPSFDTLQVLTAFYLMKRFDEQTNPKIRALLVCHANDLFQNISYKVVPAKDELRTATRFVYLQLAAISTAVEPSYSNQIRDAELLDQMKARFGITSVPAVEIIRQQLALKPWPSGHETKPVKDIDEIMRQCNMYEQLQSILPPLDFCDRRDSKYVTFKELFMHSAQGTMNAIEDEQVQLTIESLKVLQQDLIVVGGELQNQTSTIRQKMQSLYNELFQDYAQKVFDQHEQMRNSQQKCVKLIQNLLDKIEDFQKINLYMYANAYYCQHVSISDANSKFQNVRASLGQRGIEPHVLNIQKYCEKVKIDMTQIRLNYQRFEQNFARLAQQQ